MWCCASWAPEDPSGTSKIVGISDDVGVIYPDDAFVEQEEEVRLERASSASDEDQRRSPLLFGAMSTESLGTIGISVASPFRYDRANSSHTDQHDSLGWVNYILETTWPHWRTALSDLVKNIISKEVSSQIRARNLLGFNIDISINTEFDIGSKPPHLKNIVATHTGRGTQEGIELLAHLDMESAEDFHFTLAISGRVSGLPINTAVGLAKFTLQGNACILLSPLVDAVPIFAGGKIYFLDLPDLHFEFFGMHSAGKLLGPILVQAVQTCAEKLLQSFVVPGGIYVPITPIPPANLMPTANPAPFGYVVATVYEAKGVFGGDFSLFSKETSDPSVTIQLGGTTFTTSYHTNTSRPTWDPPESVFLPLFHHNQQLHIDVSDVDLGDRRDLLGQFSGTVQTIHEKLEGKDWIEMALTPEAQKAMPDPNQKMEVLLSTEFLEVCKLNSEDDLANLDSLPEGDGDSEYELGGPRQLPVDYTRLLRLCSVKLMGMEAPEEFVDEVLYCTALVSIDPGKPPRNFHKEKKGGILKKGLESLGRKLWFSSPSGGTLKQPPMKTKKARAWGASHVSPKGSYLNNVSAHSQLMIERLAVEKKMPYAEIAKIAGITEDQVKLLVEMQRSLKVVWYQSFHRLLEYPGGSVSVEVTKEDKTSVGKVTLDLSEVEAEEEKIKQVRIPLDGPGTRGRDVVLVFDVELQGMKRSKLKKRRGHMSYTAPDHSAAAPGPRGPRARRTVTAAKAKGVRRAGSTSLSPLS